MSDERMPAKVRLTDVLGPPLEDALKRAYYYTEDGDWRGPEVDEWDRWHAVATVAAAQVEAERERIKARLLGMDDATSAHNYYAHAAWVLFERA